MAKPRLPKTLQDVVINPSIVIVQDRFAVQYPGYAKEMVISLSKNSKERKYYKSVYQVGEDSTDIEQPMFWRECVPVQVTEYVFVPKLPEENVEHSKASRRRSESR